MRARESAAEYVVKNGKLKAVSLPIEEYEEIVEDLYDLAVIEQRKNEPTIPLAEVERRLKQRIARRRTKVRNESSKKRT